MKRLILLVPLSLITSIGVYAQSMGPATINAAGGWTSIGANEFEWSIGEMTMVTTISATGITVTQGVLQPADVTLGVAGNSKLQDQLQVFPNPATSEVNLKYSSPVQGSLVYKLMDVAGKVIKTQTIQVKPGTTSEKINITELACAAYMLEVVINPENASTEKASYKIEKLK